MSYEAIHFGITTETGKPYVWGCRDEMHFESIDHAAEFIEARARARLNAYQTIWWHDPDRYEGTTIDDNEDNPV